MLASPPDWLRVELALGSFAGDCPRWRRDASEGVHARTWAVRENAYGFATRREKLPRLGNELQQSLNFNNR
jgi:hypothetical protein